MAIEPDLVQKAIDDQAEYWGRVIDTLTFVKTTPLTQKLIKKVSALPVEYNEVYLDHAIQSMESEYGTFARWWLNSYMLEHTRMMWRFVFNNMKKTHDVNTAMNVADDVEQGLIKVLQARYP